MKKRWIAVSGTVMLTMSLIAGCAGGTATDAGSTGSEKAETETQAKQEKQEPEIVIPEYSTVDYTVDFFEDLTSVESFESECDQKGTVVTLDYEAPAYAINEVLGKDEKDFANR